MPALHSNDAAHNTPAISAKMLGTPLRAAALLFPLWRALALGFASVCVCVCVCVCAAGPEFAAGVDTPYTLAGGVDTDTGGVEMAMGVDTGDSDHRHRVPCRRAQIQARQDTAAPG
ncbi:hypothetical protein C8R44DRAFT_865501 [Mycena epipterygia]|nr:hypothetical protein C8R44DRAFT_865501 [Mycena epipterygia]